MAEAETRISRLLPALRKNPLPTAHRRDWIPRHTTTCGSVINGHLPMDGDRDGGRFAHYHDGLRTAARLWPINFHPEFIRCPMDSLALEMLNNIENTAIDSLTKILGSPENVGIIIDIYSMEDTLQEVFGIEIISRNKKERKRIERLKQAAFFSNIAKISLEQNDIDHCVLYAIQSMLNLYASDAEIGAMTRAYGKKSLFSKEDKSTRLDRWVMRCKELRQNLPVSNWAETLAEEEKKYAEEAGSRAVGAETIRKELRKVFGKIAGKTG